MDRQHVWLTTASNNCGHGEMLIPHESAVVVSFINFLELRN